MTLPWFQNGAYPLYLAPMAGFTDVVYRELCKRAGADVLVSEFVLADSLVHGRPEVWETVDFSENQRPMGVQIFGSSPEIMGEAARAIIERLRPDFIDLNFGCPSDKVTCRDAGSSLLKNPPKLQRVAAQVVEAVAGTGVPVTGKIRTGWDAQSIVALEVGRRLQDAGVRAVAIHGRTKEQGYRGEADWETIAAVAEDLEIPVIGNGNISDAADVLRVQRETAVRGIMIGRAALGYPWLFGEIKTALKTGAPPPPPTLEARWETLLTYARLLLARPLRDQKAGDIRWMRPRLIKLTKDMTACKRVRGELQQVTRLEHLEALAQRHLEHYRDADRKIQQGTPRIQAVT